MTQSERRLQNSETPSVPLDDFKGADVLFGVDSPGLYDRRPAPVSGVYPRRGAFRRDAAGKHRQTKEKMWNQFAEALLLFYRGDFAGAQKKFMAITDEDDVAKSYVAKCGELIAEPPENWQGVWMVTQK
ncbi:MAG: hypothetical protein K4571_02570 [Deltaproteobacteria bacterium]